MMKHLFFQANIVKFLVFVATYLMSILLFLNSIAFSVNHCLRPFFL